MNSSKKAYLFAGLAVFFWSTVATAFKIALREYDFIQLIFYASGVTVLLLFLVLIFQQKSGSIFQQTQRQWLNSLFMGALNPLLYYLVLFKAYSLLPAQVAQPVNMIWPITGAAFGAAAETKNLVAQLCSACHQFNRCVFYCFAGWRRRF